MHTSSTFAAHSLLLPNWPAAKRVQAFTSTRTTHLNKQPASQGDYASFNLGLNVGDSFAEVSARREALAAAVGRPINWLNQTHSTLVATSFAPNTEADACVTATNKFACAVLTADCLPVFFCDAAATQVGVAHAGWRGLAAGVLENTLAKFTCPRAEILAWLGPAISQQAFEVGEEVKQAFLAASPPKLKEKIAAAFIPSQRPNHLMACLHQLAKIRLAAAGVEQIYTGDALNTTRNFCTYTNQQDFYSYRYSSHQQQEATGRLASIIWLEN